MKDKKLAIYLITILLAGGLNGYVQEHNQTINEQDIYQGIEIDDISGLPVLDINNYTQSELKEILHIMSNEGVALQKALYIPLVSGVSLELVLDGVIDYDTYIYDTRLILESMAYHLDNYATYTTTNKAAQQYHGAVVQASRQLYNGMVKYYGALVEKTNEEGKKELIVNNPMYEQAIVEIEMNYKYIAMMEQIMESMNKKMPSQLKNYTDKVDSELDLIGKDLEKKLK